jgi:acetylornithine deacetylase/succinyl-diaminopimelate desuccinylase-like protein
MAGHSGTVPMRLRQDALVAAAECVLAAERIAGAVPDAVATVGQLAPSPGATNVIPGRAVFSLDVRSPRDADRTQVAAAILDECRAIAARRKIGIEVAVELVGRGETAALTGVDTRQKPIRLIAERGRNTPLVIEKARINFKDRSDP